MTKRNVFVLAGMACTAAGGILAQYEQFGWAALCLGASLIHLQILKWLRS